MRRVTQGLLLFSECCVSAPSFVPVRLFQPRREGLLNVACSCRCQPNQGALQHRSRVCEWASVSARAQPPPGFSLTAAAVTLLDGDGVRSWCCDQRHGRGGGHQMPMMGAGGVWGRVLLALCSTPIRARLLASADGAHRQRPASHSQPIVV